MHHARRHHHRSVQGLQESGRSPYKQFTVSTNEIEVFTKKVELSTKKETEVSTNKVEVPAKVNEVSIDKIKVSAKLIKDISKAGKLHVSRDKRGGEGHEGLTTNKTLWERNRGDSSEKDKQADTQNNTSLWGKTKERR